MKLEISNKRKTGKFIKSWELNNTLFKKIFLPIRESDECRGGGAEEEGQADSLLSTELETGLDLEIMT